MTTVAAKPITRIRSSRAAPALPPFLSIIVVNYRQWGGASRICSRLGSSSASKRTEVVVVDNESKPHPVRRRLRRADGVSIRCFRRNLGFARGANEGCRLARGDWFLILNPDAELEPAFLELVEKRLAYLLARDPNVGIVGARLLDSDGRFQGSAGYFPTLPRMLVGLLRSRPRRKYSARLSARRGPVPWVTGCGMLVRRDCFEAIGGFDPAFFLYYEDVDLCRRARAAGWNIWFEPTLRVVHHHPLQSRPISPRLRLLTRHAGITFARRYWPQWQSRILMMMAWAESILRQKLHHCGNPREAGLFQRLREIVKRCWMGNDRSAYRIARNAAQKHRIPRSLD